MLELAIKFNTCKKINVDNKACFRYSDGYWFRG